MIYIQLTQGKVALIDDIDADLATLGWYAVRNGKTFYAARHVRQIDGRRTIQYLHQAVTAKIDTAGEVDHRDRDGLNCTRDNLRAATRGQNNANQSTQRNNTSGVKGVHFNKRARKWHARVTINRKHCNLGYFDDLELAKAAVIAARERFFGEFARHD